VAFQAVIEALQKEGLIPKRAKQRLDSTHVLAAVFIREGSVNNSRLNSKFYRPTCTPRQLGLRNAGIKMACFYRILQTEDTKPVVSLVTRRSLLRRKCLTSSQAAPG
jgi:hypothetical protein